MLARFPNIVSYSACKKLCTPRHSAILMPAQQFTRKHSQLATHTVSSSFMCNMQITDSNQHLLRSGYTKRRPEELAVLSR